jgi:hypothetical protein
MHKYTNRLADETSPYLLQHAHNPVNWFPWGDEALQLAKKENKPILVSIGYSACHWCHVMERESFEDEATAEIMNHHFINIKIDREERPDLDHIYMDAVQAMTGSGGWPLNVFLTPDAKPFYGGTYFPPSRAFNRSSWQEVLLGVSVAFTERRHEIDAQAESLTEHLTNSNLFGLKTGGDDFFISEKMDEAFQSIMKTADREWGGFGRAPKFPQTFVIQFLLRYYHTTKSEEALKQALLSIDKMIDGGIYDQVGGGFARYATDTEWLVPHFEKMLYDNALLLSVISEAYQLTRNERYREVIEETIQFVQRELKHPRGGFYSALDADSEGEEGKFYVWNYEEAKVVLQEDTETFCSFFDITHHGNWEGKNILRRKKSEKEFCGETGIPEAELKKIIQRGKEKLLTKRSERIRPQLDDKILLSWNALMNTALSKAFEATGWEEYRQLAIDNMQFLLSSFSKNDQDFFHTWKNNETKHPAFLDDYACLIQALIQLQVITADTIYLHRAKKITEHVMKHFGEENTGFFFYTHKNQPDVIVRKKEVYDGAQPSGNAVMADNLYRLSLYFDLAPWREKSEVTTRALGSAITRYPSSFGAWACMAQEMITGTSEIAVLGTDFSTLHQQVLKAYIPHKILMCSAQESIHFPLLSDKRIGDKTQVYLCRDYACRQPVTTIQELQRLINTVR